MTAENFSPEESLELIRSMISKTRSNISYHRFYFLLWGWCCLAACVGQFVLKVYFNSNWHPIVWLINIPCFIITIYYSIRFKKKELVKTYVGESMGYLWAGVSISYIVLTILFFRIGWNNCFPFYCLLYGLGAFVSGKILQFKPLTIGGYLSWILAIASVFFSFDYQVLFGAGALLFSYIIPGHLIGQIKEANGI